MLYTSCRPLPLLLLLLLLMMMMRTEAAMPGMMMARRTRRRRPGNSGEVHGGGLRCSHLTEMGGDREASIYSDDEREKEIRLG